MSIYKLTLMHKNTSTDLGYNGIHTTQYGRENYGR